MQQDKQVDAVEITQQLEDQCSSFKDMFYDMAINYSTIWCGILSIQ